MVFITFNLFTIIQKSFELRSIINVKMYLRVDNTVFFYRERTLDDLNNILYLDYIAELNKP